MSKRAQPEAISSGSTSNAWLPPPAPPDFLRNLMIILISYMMIGLDISIVITALPKMRAGLGFSTTGFS